MSKVKHKNEIRRNLILRALLDNGELSLTELMKITGITIAVVLAIIASLVKEGLIIEVKNKDNTQAGRPPYLVKLNGKAGFILGIDIGRLYSNFIVMDLEHKILVDVRKKSIPLSNDIGLLDQLEKEIKTVISEGKINWNKLLGIGISISGMVKGRLAQVKLILISVTSPQRKCWKTDLKNLSILNMIYRQWLWVNYGSAVQKMKVMPFV